MEEGGGSIVKEGEIGALYIYIHQRKPIEVFKELMRYEGVVGSHCSGSSQGRDILEIKPLQYSRVSVKFSFFPAS